MSKQILLFAIVCVACGARVESQSAPDAALDTEAADVAWEVGPEPVPKTFCPDTEPMEGAECELGTGQYSLGCSYGDSPQPECRSWLVCGPYPDGVARWARRSTPCKGEPTPCPTTRPEERSACARHEAACVYPDGALCWCFAGDSTWSCAEPSAPCPTNVPNDGTRCAVPMYCLYGKVHGCIDPGVSAECVDGRWVWTGACSDK